MFVASEVLDSNNNHQDEPWNVEIVWSPVNSIIRSSGSCSGSSSSSSSCSCTAFK